MKRSDMKRIGSLFDQLSERNKEIAYAYASGLLDYQNIRKNEAAKDVAAR